MEYENMVKLMTNDGQDQFRRAERLIREMCDLIVQLLDYRFIAEKYDGNGTVDEDHKNQLKKTLALIVSDMDIYMEQTGITEDVKDKANKRLARLVNRIS